MSDRRSFKTDEQDSDRGQYDEKLNLVFNTKIFTQNNDYIFELGNIYGAKALIDSALSQIIPNVKNYQKISRHVEQLLDAMDDLKVAAKKCVFEMEEQRRSMYTAAKKMI